ncbi:MAG: hypothetical protein IKI76_00650 [Selenomonadaceae bacterium]|nr:hypothetical protein [Selenomonadaceae bacterium]
MLNTISASFLKSYQSVVQFSNQSTTSTKPDTEQNPVTNFMGDTTVEISDEGLNALANAKTNDEAQLSDKAKSFLENLRKKYGDYDFIVSNDMDTSKTVGSTKEYSVMFTAEEIEKMAADEDYAEKMMGQVGSAVDMLKNLSEKDLGEGVQFSQLSVSFDSEGNMKLFAQLEKLSTEQQERLEAAKEKRAEEQKASEEATTEKTPEDGMPVVFKSADVEASNEEELLAKIFGINWDEIPEEEALI